MKFSPKLLKFIMRQAKSFEKRAARLQGKGYGYHSLREEVAQALGFLDSVKVFFDVGANCGNYAIEVLARFPTARAHLFEPAGLNLDFLQSRFSQQENVNIHRVAIRDRQEKCFLHADRPGSALASVFKRNLDHFMISFEHREEVEAKTLDQYLGLLGPDEKLDLLKLDIEGAELSALAGGKKLLSRTRVVQFEFGGCNIDSRTFFQDFWRIFKALGFKIFRISPLGPVQIADYQEWDEFFITTNYLAVNENERI